MLATIVGAALMAAIAVGLWRANYAPVANRPVAPFLSRHPGVVDATLIVGIVVAALAMGGYL